MANRRRTPSRRGGGAGGVKGILASGVMILVVAASVLGWWNYNGFKSVSDAIGWFQQKSANMDTCVDGELAADHPDAQNIANAHGCLLPNIVGEGKGPTGGNLTLADDDKEITIKSLDQLTVAPPKDVNYNRSQWKHWIDEDGDGCNTREQVLVAQGTDVTTDPNTCKVLSGTWIDNYSAETFTDPGALDIDHVVPLSWAAANGGNDWDADKKMAFANDPSNLFISDASENRSKGDKGPAEYLPPNLDFQCLYVNSFLSTINKYQLSLSQVEKTAIEKTIEERC